MSKELISLNELFKSDKIDWIQSQLTLRRWVERDIETNNVLEAIVIPPRKGKTGKRYLIPIKNIDSFIERCKNNTLYEENN